MKRLFLLALFTVALSLPSLAQTEKGWRSVGGTGRLTLDFKNSSHYFDLSPEVYWFVADNFALGTDFGIGFFTSTTGPDSLETKASSVDAYVTPGIRYYFRDVEKKWRPYGFLNGGFETYANRTKVGNADAVKSSGNGFRGYAGAGLAWFFSDHAAFDIRLHVVDYTRNDIYFNPSFAIGIQAFFD